MRKVVQLVPSYDEADERYGGRSKFVVSSEQLDPR